ncbi:MAG: hypothetical protein OXI22_11830 [Defluviicoccus sp.]|nr:hypothetical protein [Defluviicoccus sp.]MDE0384565.1 hypothetical protein [Defluviicoccus sp.]
MTSSLTVRPSAADAALGDEAPYDRARAGGGEPFPAEIADRLLAGESPIREHRLYRGMTQKRLAEAAGMDLPRRGWRRFAVTPARHARPPDRVRG